MNIKKYVIATIFILFFVNMISACSTDYDSIVHTDNPITVKDTLYQSTIGLQTNIIHTYEPTLTPTSSTETSLPNKLVFGGTISNTIVDKNGYIYYIDQNYIKRERVSNDKIETIVCSKYNILQILLTDMDLLYLVNNYDKTEYDVYMQKEDKEICLIKDIDNVIFASQEFWYYTKEASIYKYDCKEKKSQKLDFKENTDIEMVSISNDQGIVYFQADNADNINSLYAMDIVSGKILSQTFDGIIYYGSLDKKNLLGFDDSNHKITLYDLNCNPITTFMIPDGTEPEGFVVSDSKAYIMLYDRGDKRFISVVDIDTNHIIKQIDYYECNWLHVMCTKDMLYENGQIYIFLYDPIKLAYKDSADEYANEHYLVKPKLFRYTLIDNRLEEVGNFKHITINMYNEPKITLVNNHLWFFDYEFNSSYEYKFNIEIK